MNINEMVEIEIANGFSGENAEAKVCQDIIIKAISNSSLSRHLTIKGGVVMRGKTGNTRRATQDLDIDFIRYSLDEDAIDIFIKKLNCINDISIKREGNLVELKQQDYKGKRINIKITDNAGNTIISKIDIGVHTYLDIEQEEYCFDISFDNEGASVLINSNEQMFAEKLKSLLKFGPVSTRYKDIFDLYYLGKHVENEKLKKYLKIFIYDDVRMKEESIDDILHRMKLIFRSKNYVSRVDTSRARWLDEDINTIIESILKTLTNAKK